MSAVSLPAFAEEAAAQADAPATEAASDASTGGGIVVTATRRSERAINVPIAVSSLSGEKLDVLNSSGQDIRFLASRVPSLQIRSSFGALSALLHPWPWQHRLQRRRGPAGFGRLRQRRARKPDAQGLPGLRP
jgi:hypothetical protein